MSWLTGTVILLCLTFGLSHAILEEPTPTTIKDHGGDFIYFLVPILPASTHQKFLQFQTSLLFHKIHSHRFFKSFSIQKMMKIFSNGVIKSFYLVSTCSALNDYGDFSFRRWKLFFDWMKIGFYSKRWVQILRLFFVTALLK